MLKYSDDEKRRITYTNNFQCFRISALDIRFQLMVSFDNFVYQIGLILTINNTCNKKYPLFAAVFFIFYTRNLKERNKKF